MGGCSLNFDACNNSDQIAAPIRRMDRETVSVDPAGPARSTRTRRRWTASRGGSRQTAVAPARPTRAPAVYTVTSSRRRDPDEPDVVRAGSRCPWTRRAARSDDPCACRNPDHRSATATSTSSVATSSRPSSL